LEKGAKLIKKKKEDSPSDDKFRDKRGRKTKTNRGAIVTHLPAKKRREK